MQIKLYKRKRGKRGGKKTCQLVFLAKVKHADFYWLLAIEMFENHWNGRGLLFNPKAPTWINKFFVNDLQQGGHLEFTEFLSHSEGSQTCQLLASALRIFLNIFSEVLGCEWSGLGVLGFKVCLSKHIVSQCGARNWCCQKFGHSLIRPAIPTGSALPNILLCF